MKSLPLEITTRGYDNGEQYASLKIYPEEFEFIVNNNNYFKLPKMYFKNISEFILSKTMGEWAKCFQIVSNQFQMPRSTLELHVLVSCFHIASNLSLEKIWESSDLKIDVSSLCGNKYEDKLPPKNFILFPNHIIQEKLKVDNDQLGDKLFYLGRLFKLITKQYDNNEEKLYFRPYHTTILLESDLQKAGLENICDELSKEYEHLLSK